MDGWMDVFVCVCVCLSVCVCAYACVYVYVLMDHGCTDGRPMYCVLY